MSCSDSIIRSSAFPGLWLAVTALLEGRIMDVLGMLQTGLASPEHQAFVQGVIQPGDR